MLPFFILGRCSGTWCIALLLSAFVACDTSGENTPGSTDAGMNAEDLSIALFAPDHLIEVEVELEPADWAALREEGRRLTDVFTGCGREYEYTYYSP